MALAPFPVNPVLTDIAIAYENQALIADEVLPRLDVDGQTFKWLQFDSGETLLIPNTRVGRYSPPDDIEVTATEQSASCIDYGLQSRIPQQDIDNKRRRFDPVQRATERVTNLMLLDREVRVANAIFASGNYTSTRTLSGTSQWNDTTNSTPIKDITDALDVPIFRPNTLVLGQAVFTTLARHPDILKAVHANQGDKGFATAEQIRSIFPGIERVLVGQAFVNSAKKGQTASTARAWGKFASLLYLDPNADSTQGGPTFGYTAQYGTRIAGDFPDPNIGAKGGVRVRVVESVKEVIAAKDLGYLLINAIA